MYYFYSKEDIVIPSNCERKLLKFFVTKIAKIKLYYRSIKNNGP